MANLRTTLRHYEAEQARLQKQLRQEQKEFKIAKMHQKPAKMIAALYQKKVKVNELPYDSDFIAVGQVLQNKWQYTRGKKVDFYEFVRSIARSNTTKIFKEVSILRYAFHYAAWWCNNPKKWKPDEEIWADERALVLDLLHYLFAKFPVPGFMNQAWIEQNDRHIAWFVHLGQGLNIRTAPNLPIELTKKMAHYFTQAPAGSTIQEALRYAQIMGMGGANWLATCLDATAVGRMLEHRDFWATVIGFFMQNRRLGAYEMNEMVEYIYHQKFLPRRIRNREGKWEVIAPPKPKLTLKGRTLESLKKSVEKWKTELEKEREMLSKLGEDEFIQWRAIGVRDFTHSLQQNGVLRTYKIQQLVSNFELKEEAKAMNHCVATYVPNCIDGNSSIWSMTLVKPHHKPKRMVTIEVDNDSTIQQVKAKNNELPAKEVLDVINIWMDAEQLSLVDDY